MADTRCVLLASLLISTVTLFCYLGNIGIRERYVTDGDTIHNAVHRTDRGPNIHNNKNISAIGIQTETRTRDGLKRCSHDLLRAYFSKLNRFPGSGQWENTGNTSHFYPDFCHLDNRLNFVSLSSCVRRNKMTSMVVMGDSNGQKYFTAFVRFLNDTGLLCTQTMQENRTNTAEGKLTPDKRYYTYGLRDSVAKHVRVRQGSCRTCTGSTYMCSTEYQPKISMSVRFVSNFILMDNTIQVLDSNEKVIAGTAQEFYFRFLFKGNYPDVLVMFLPFHHIKRKPNLTGTFFHDINRMMNLINTYIPRTTKVFFVPSHGEFESKRSGRALPFKNKRYYGLLADDMDRKLGRMFFNGTRKYLLGDSRIFGFFDLWELGHSREEWCLDGTHMKDIWYDNVALMFLELFCNSSFK